MKRILKIISGILLWTTGILLVLLIALILLIRLPSVQNKIVHEATAYISGKTKTKVELQSLYIGLPKTVVITGLFAEDLNHDTLLALDRLEIDIDLFALMNSEVNINSVFLDGLTANIKRSLPDSTFNFDFFIKAFASANPDPVPEPADTSASSWKISADKIRLSNINASFTDDVGGMDMRVQLGELDVNMEDMDLAGMRFDAGDISVKNTKFTFVINKESPETPDTSTVVSMMPLLSAKKIDLANVQFYFGNKPSGMMCDFQAGDISMIPDIIDLNNHFVKAKEVRVHKTIGIVAITASNEPDKPEIPGMVSTDTSQWRAAADKIFTENVDFRFDIVNAPKEKYGMDYAHMYFKNAMIQVENASYSPEKIVADIKHISLTERCGLNLKRLHAKAEYDDRHAALADLLIVTPGSVISNYVEASWPSLDALGKDPGVLGVSVNLHKTRVSLDDVLMFVPMLRNQPPFNSPKGKTVAVSGNINGLLKDIVINDLLVRTGKNTAIELNAHLKGLPDAQTAYYDLDLRTFATTREDVLSLLPKKMIPVNIPASLLLSGSFKGSLSDFKTDILLRSSSGEVKVNATMKKSGSDTLYTAKISIDRLDIGYLLNKQPMLGRITLTSDIKGKNFAPLRMNTITTTSIKAFDLNRYQYKNIQLSADATSGKYAAAMIINDSNIILNMSMAASVIDSQESVFAEVELEGADLYALNLSRDKVRTSGRLDVNLKGKGVEDLNGRVGLSRVLVIKNDRKYRIDSFLVASVNDKKHSALKIKSGLLNVDYDGSLTLSNLSAALTHHIDRYFDITTDPEVVRKDTSEQNFTLGIKVMPQPILNEVLLPGLERFNGADIIADFDNVKQQLNMVVSAPVVGYKGSNITNLRAEIHSGAESMKYSLVFNSLRTGNIRLPETSLAGDIKNNQVNFALNVIDKDSGNKLLISGDLRKENEGYGLHLSPKPVFNNEVWAMPENNYIRIRNGGLFAQNFTLGNQKQLISVTSDGSDESAPVKITLKEFQLATLSQIVEDDTAFIRGSLNGNLELRNLQTNPAFVSDLKISNVVINEHPVGNINITADNLTADKYVAIMSLTGNGNQLKVNATYLGTGDQNLNIDVNIEKMTMASIEPFTARQLRQSSGYVTGKIKITGAAAKPQINGDIRFKNAAFNVAYLNSYITLKDERISVDPQGIYFKSFIITDSAGQRASISGSVLTTDYIKMKYDLTVKTSRFTILNTGINDNPLYFGRILLSSTITVKGNESLPVVNADIKLLGGTRINVIVPSSQLSTDKGDGVVILIDTTSTDKIMTRIDTVPVITTFKGLDINANIQIDKQTTFKVIVDRVSGDSLVARGDGSLSFAMDASGKQSLTGSYVLNYGSYNASFQGVIKRDFKIRPGSSINWSGGPTDATIDLTAIYTTRTSPADLLASELTGASVAERSAYRKLMYFDVNMIMKGPLLKPQISFALDMRDRDKNAFGGIVYSKISSLNSDPAELNKQVFALLVLNKFVPSGGASNTGESSASNNIARNSVNQVLSDQLNQLSGKYIKDVELNFDIQTNDDYSANSVQQNTEVNVGLKKEFFNDRISVQVGSSVNVQGSTPVAATQQGNTSNLTGDVVVEYKITEDGRYRFKAFRDNQYEGIIDGLLYRTGVGIVYTRDYNTIKELLSPPKKEKEVEVETEPEPQVEPEPETKPEPQPEAPRVDPK